MLDRETHEDAQRTRQVSGGILDAGIRLIHRLFRLLADRLYERISLRNYSTSAVGSTLQLSLSADYADTFEVRGVTKRKARGQALAPKVTAPGLKFGYVGEDDVFRETLVAFDPAPTELTEIVTVIHRESA